MPRVRRVNLLCPLVFTAASTLAAARSPIKIVDEGGGFALSDGQANAQAGKTTGDPTSVEFRGLERLACRQVARRQAAGANTKSAHRAGRFFMSIDCIGVG
jgi:hypothetical protein